MSGVNKMGVGFNLFRSSIGRKVLMAVTGLGLIGFLFGHLLGNLQFFAGPDKINAYAVFLKSLGPVLWLARIGTLTLFVVHVGLGIVLARENRLARPAGYIDESTVQASWASRHMAATGVIILVFVLVHLAHFTLGMLQPELFHYVDSQGRHDVYRMVVMGFQNYYYSVFYIAAMVVLGIHLSHAISSCLQTLGLMVYPRCYRMGKILAHSVSTVLALGYISIPVAVLLGVIKL